jgi:hypothetical protein
MKNKLLTILLTFTILLFSACGGRTSYVNNFENFINKAEANADTYTSADWERADAEFEKYTDEYFNKNERSLTDEDKKKIGKLHAKYYTIRAKAFGKQLKEGIKDAASYLEGFMEGLSEATENVDNE